MNEDKASRYHRLRRRASLTGAGLEALLLAGLLASGASAAMRDAAGTWGGGWPGAVVMYCLLLAVASELLQFPVSLYQQVLLERRYGLLTQSTARWLADHAKGGAIGLVLGTISALVVVGLVRISPERWWIGAAIVFSVALIGLARVAPVLILPLFYDVRPLERAGLVARLVTLAERVGTPVVGVFEWRLSDHTRKANAVLAGLGPTRRILVSDTLLAEHTDDEIAVILAHELAHHVHRDLWSGLALETGVLTLGLYVADRALGASVGLFGLDGKADIAALPVVLLAGGAVSLAARPIANLLSRYHERRADRFALELTRDVGSFVTAMKRLAAQNLAEERPSRLVELLLYSHPPIVARIAAAQTWAARSSHPAA
jgi:STE24 endopeptidase